MYHYNPMTQHYLLGNLPNLLPWGKPRLFVFINILLKAADLMLGKSCVWVENGETKSLILKLWVSIVFPQTTQLAIVLLGIPNFIVACCHHIHRTKQCVVGLAYRCKKGFYIFYYFL